MEKSKPANYYKELPVGYKEVYCINAKKTSVGVILNVLALVIAVALIIGVGYAKFCWDLEFYRFDYQLIFASLVALASYLAYLVVHELTHGLFYKILTRQKLRFGLTLTVAYCGLKDGFVNKKTCLLAVLAPLVIHSIWMVLLIILLPASIWLVMLIVLFGLHVGGCAGDIWVALLLIFRFRGNSVLVCDDGPCQRFYDYCPDEAAEVKQGLEGTEENGDR